MISRLNTLGIPYRVDSYGRIGSIKLPFTPEQFVDVCNTGGDLLPQCCPTVSEMRDIIINTLRDGGWIQFGALSELVLLMKTHDGFKEMFRNTSCENPFGRIAQAWDAMSDCMPLNETPPRRLDPSRIRDAAALLSNACSVYWMRSMYRRDALPEDDQVRLEHDVNRITAILRILPPLRTLWHEILEEAPAPVMGWCAVIKAHHEMESSRKISTDPFGHGIVITSSGLGIYQTRTDLEEAISVWVVRYPHIRDLVEIRHVRVSAEDGITFMDEEVK